VRPYATIVLVAVCLLIGVVIGAYPLLGIQLGLYGPVEGEWWRLAVTPFIHENLGYLFITMVATAIFGTQLERRFGPLAPPLVFVACGAAGAALCVALGSFPAIGANGAALGLLVAWLVDDRRAYRRGDDRGNDLIGVYVIAAVLVLLAVAEPDANPVAAAGGAAAGAVLGAALGLTRR
jgi:membrane associated rhomboid family serine protease